MPTYPSTPSGETIYTRHSRGEPNWALVSQSEYDGLAPSQIVRAMDAPDRGWEETEAQSRIADRLDATPDADNLVTNPAPDGAAKGVTVDAHRYVVDPLVEKHRYTGLYTGGPVRHVEEQGRKRIVQALTRTFCAGHGYYVDEVGRYHAVWPNGSGGWTEHNPDEPQVVYEAADPSALSMPNLTTDPEAAKPYEESREDRVFLVREYATAADCLKAHRPALNSAFTPYMAFRSDLPGTYRREVVWREFTHESANALEELGTDRTALQEVVAYHFGARVAGSVVDAHVRLDPQTNTLIFVAALVWKEPYDPGTPEELLALPHIDGPCTRETLRAFGYDELANGEGYKYTHVFKWINLADSERVRNLCEFVKDSDVVLQLLGIDALAHEDSDSDSDSDGSDSDDGEEGNAPHGDPEDGWKPGKPTVYKYTDGGVQLDQTGRYVIYLDRETGAPCEPTASNAVIHPWYRITLQKLQPDGDGRLEFTLILSRPEWHGYDKSDGTTRLITAVQNPQGWGVAENRVVVSVPREDAVHTMNGIQPRDTYHVITAKHRTEGSGGHSDVPFQEERLWDYVNTEHTPDGIQNPFISGLNGIFQSYNPYPRPNYQVTYEKVAPDKVPDLIAHIKSKLGGDPSISLTYHPGGYYTVSARGTGREPRHIEEWLVMADWYHHETVEQWLGVTLVTREVSVGGVTKTERGFWAFDQDSDSDSDGDDGTWHSVAEIRGDLDANWMGADPQLGAPSFNITTGIGPDAFIQRPEYHHGDDHDLAGYNTRTGKHIGWTAGQETLAWEDPDVAEGNGGGMADSENTGDGGDKARSHVLTNVHLSVNDDGTYNIRIGRNYPHQRVHYYETRVTKKRGDWKPVYHAVFTNWPSRKAIWRDLVARVLGRYNIDLTGEDRDDYTWNFGPTVNDYGLVSSHVTIEPVIWTERKKNNDSVDESLTNLSRYEIHPIKRGTDSQATKTSPEAGVVVSEPGFAPLLGHYFNIKKWPVYEGCYKTQTRAQTVYNRIVGTNATAAGNLQPYKSGNAWFFRVVLAPMYGPTDFVYNGEYPGATALTFDDADVHNIPEKDRLPVDPGGEKEDDQELARKFNKHLADASADGGSISRATWETWFRGGANSQGQAGQNGAQQEQEQQGDSE